MQKYHIVSRGFLLWVKLGSVTHTNETEGMLR